ncbi:MAG: ABC transporter permease, partial [Chthoniobacterales bacterium]|nr:ABC transporter permease [Chthoniobacterales bacterium]
ELPLTLLRELKKTFGSMPVELIPILELSATSPSNDPNSIAPRPLFQLIGCDLIALQNLQYSDEPEDFSMNQEESKETLQSLFISHSLASEKKLKVGDRFPLVIANEVFDFHIAGFIPESKSRPKISSRLIVIDLPLLQELTHHQGQLSQINCSLPESTSRDLEKKRLLETLQKSQSQLGGFEIFTSKDQRAKAALMTRAFRMNLTILSLIALLAGLYLILQALDGAVVRRRGEIAVLRSLGVTKEIIQIHWLTEALLLGLAGGLLGSLLGWGTAQFAIRSIGSIVNALYFTTSVNTATLDWSEFFLAIILAVSSALLTGWWPAHQAAETPPAQILSHEFDKSPPKGLFQSILMGVLLLLLSGLLSLAPAATLFNNRRLPLCGYIATLLLILGGGIFCGFFTEKLGLVMTFFGKFSFIVRLAASHLKPLSKRHYLAASGILCGVTMAAGMLILIQSFEKTMQRWISTVFQADLYISSADYQGSSLEHHISPQIWKSIVQDPRIADIQLITSRSITLNNLPTIMNGIDIGFLKRHHNILWKEAPKNDDFFNPEKNSHLVLVNESFLERFQHRCGDHVIIPTAYGDQEMTIAGVFCDYGNEQGSLFIDRAHFANYFKEDGATVLIAMVQPEVDPEQLRLQFSSQFPGLTTLTNRNLREEILRVFHQTFSITYALELIGIIVAIIGLGMTLSNILIDRAKELTTLRALGCTQHTIATAMALEGGLLALSGAFIGILTSLGMGSILIYVINKQSFGWTLQFSIPYFSLAILAIAVVTSGTLVSYLVARQNSLLKVEIHD